MTNNGRSGSQATLDKLSLGQVPIVLMYHGVEEVPADPHGIVVTPARFAEQMTWLKGRGLRGVGMGMLVDAMRAGRAQGLVGITFDDGYVNVLDNAVPELLRHGFTATTFIISGRLGGTNEWDAGPVWPLMSADQVKAVAAAGMEIGSHSATHTRLAGVGAERLKAEIDESRSNLSNLVGHPIRGFAYPYGNMDAAARRAVRDTGYDYACSVETPMANLGIMALPRIVFNQQDGSGRMAAKRLFFRSYTAVKGTRRMMAYNPLAQTVKKRLYAIVRSPHDE